MGLIREPKNVDLIIHQRKTTEKELEALDAIVAELKSRNKKKRRSAKASKRKAA